jgi:hypothetical protein
LWFFKKKKKRAKPKHHSVYVIKLKRKVSRLKKVKKLNPKRKFWKPCVYVGMTGLAIEERFKNHLRGYKSSRWVKKFGKNLIPRLYEKYNPMCYEDAVKMEVKLAEKLRGKGYTVLGGH